MRYSIFLWLLLLSGMVWSGDNDDSIFFDGFETLFVAPNNDFEAARFLTQATFGPSPSDIMSLGNSTYRTWIEQQQQIPATLTREDLEAYAVSLTGSGLLRHDDRVRFWIKYAITAPDQLRQRMAFALSQIFVISDQNNILNSNVIQTAAFQDILIKNAFGNYRQLLEEVALSPAMGVYLSHLRNQKKQLLDTDSGTYSEPDENFAREIMQLFSVGLEERNMDYSLVDGDLNIAGIQAVPTYDENIVKNLARVLTGFSYQCNGGDTEVMGFTFSRDCAGGPGVTCEGVNCQFLNNSFFLNPPGSFINNGSGITHPDKYKPMVCYPRFHDTGRDENGDANPPRPNSPPYPDEPYRDKRIIGFWPGIGSGTLPMAEQRCDNLDYYINPTSAQTERQTACVNYCNNELERALDALFLHPNTAPRFSRLLIQRFVTSNPSPEYIKRVALKFNDNGAGVRGDLAAVISAILLDREARQPVTNNDFGKLKEPLLKLTAMYRAMEAVSPHPDQLFWGPSTRESTTETYAQRPLGANSVFNFYQPDHQHAGPLANDGLFAPEFQIMTENIVITMTNDIFSRVCSGYGNAHPDGINSIPNCSTGPGSDFRQPTENGYIPTTVLDSLPSDFEALVEELNRRLLYGTMSGSFNPPSGMKGILKDRLESVMADIDPRFRALLLVNLILASPEFAVQR